MQDIVYQPQGQPAADSQPLASIALPLPVPLGQGPSKAPAALPLQPLDASAQHSAPPHTDQLQRHPSAAEDVDAKQHMAQQAGNGQQQNADEVQQPDHAMDPEFPQVSTQWVTQTLHD